VVAAHAETLVPLQVIVTFDSLCSLTRSYARHPADADELCAMLDDARRRRGSGNPGARGNILRAFRGAVDARTGPQPDKSFTPEQANELKLLSTRL
jgi:hypothetical protein